MSMLKEATPRVAKHLDWAREQILIYKNFEIHAHCNERIIKDGRMSWSEIQETIQKGSFFSGSSNPNYFVGIIGYKEWCVILGRPFTKKGKAWVTKPTVLTCYRRNDASAEAEALFLMEHVTKPNQVITKEVVRHVEKLVVKPPKDMTVLELRAALELKEQEEREIWKQEKAALQAERDSFLKQSEAFAQKARQIEDRLGMEHTVLVLQSQVKKPRKARTPGNGDAGALASQPQ